MWQVDSTHDSLVAIGNGSNKQADAELTLFYNHGSEQYTIVQTLAPEQQMMVDVGKLIHNQVPDKAGHVLPPDVTWGAYRIRDLADEATGGIYEGKLIMDTTYGHAAYGCMICCGPEVPIMKYDPLDVPDLGFSNQTVLANNSCDGIQENLTGDFPTWWTANTSIATTAKNQINGKAPGSTNHHAQSQLMYWGYKTYSDPCPESKPQASAGTNVCPTSVSVSSVTQEQLANVFPTYKTGIGAVTAMQVSPTTANWDGSPITEQLSMSSNSCPLTSPWPTSPCASSSTPFTVGAGGTAKDGTLYPAEENIFYDEHYTEASQRLLNYSGLTSCQTTCTQYYYCYGMNIATFTVTRTYTKGTIQGTPVTIVTISKH